MAVGHDLRHVERVGPCGTGGKCVERDILNQGPRLVVYLSSTGAWEPSCTFSGSTGLVRWSEGECLIDLGNRVLSRDHGKIVSWITAPANVTFRLKPGTLGFLEVKDDGLYVKRGLTLFIR